MGKELMCFYDIEIDYTTGHSFGSDRNKEMLCNPADLDNTKENLKRIKQHYVECKDNPNSGKQYELTLLTNDGDRTISPFWIGYFETLHGARIVADRDDDMSFEF